MTTEISWSLFGIDVWLLVATGVYASLVLLFVTTVFLIAQIKHDNSLMDIFYGLTFIFATWGTLYLTGLMPTLQAGPLLVVTLVTVWALRLSRRIAHKNWGRPEGARYAAWRERWQVRGAAYFTLRSYLQINLLPGFIILLVSLPIIITLAHAQREPAAGLHLFALVGALVWLAGFLIETIADWQLDAFVARKKAGTETAPLMRSGLFRYSRRPNYFGESLVWWGLAIMALPLSYGWLAFLSPLLITFILTRVTGPMLEDACLEKYPDAYREHQRTTHYFIPWWPKNN